MRQITLRWRYANGAVGLLLLATTPVSAGLRLHQSRPPHDARALVLDPNMSAYAPIPGKSVTRQAMRLTTDKTRYRQGELIAVTLANELSTTILAPPQASGLCSVVSLEKLAATGWVAEGACHISAAAPLISLGPRTVMTAALISPGSSARERGVVSHPARPATRAGQSGRTADKPTQAGDLTPQYPEGIINVRGLLYPSVADLLPPGTYRIVFVYAVGTPAGPIRTIYAGPFEVTQ
jgi:hypothetical protein